MKHCINCGIEMEFDMSEKLWLHYISDKISCDNPSIEQLYVWHTVELISNKTIPWDYFTDSPWHYHENNHIPLYLVSR